MQTITIDGQQIPFKQGETILQTALNAGIYIPTLCFHPDLPSYAACGLCIIEINETTEPQLACTTPAKPNMNIITTSKNLTKIRQTKLAELLKNHPHACLVCAEREGCAREPCSQNVPLNERCCELLGDCELQRVADYIGIPENTPRYKPKNLPILQDNSIISRNYNLCIGCSRCIRACSHVRGIKALGELPDQPTLIDPETFPQKLIDNGCQFCGLCIEVCPTGALIDLIEKPKNKTPCQNSCPAEIDIPQFLREITQKKYEDAIQTMYNKVPIPATLGWVCYSPCETDCKRNNLDEAVIIRILKKFAFEQIKNDIVIEKQKRTDNPKKVAVIGAGPAGLSCAFYLTRLGHNVTIFEAKKKPGGMLQYGIPPFRLPRTVLEKEIELIQKLGVNIKLNSKITSISHLFEKGFDKVFIGIGAQKGKKMKIVGENDPRILDALQFLDDIAALKSSKEKSIKQAKTQLGKHVAIIGGGNTAIDAARSALRIGSAVTVYYRRSKKEMPAYPEEIKEAEKEGVLFQFLVTPTKIIPNEKELTVKFIRMKLGEKDTSGRPRPIPIENDIFESQVDNIIVAIGQELEDLEGVTKNSHGWLDYNNTTFAYSKDVFIGGDVTGPSSVVEAVAMGRKAALQIHLDSGGKKEDMDFTISKPKPVICEQEIFLKPRLAFSTTDGSQVKDDFSVVEQQFDSEQGVCQASRCFQCDLRLHLNKIPEPPVELQQFEKENIEQVPDAAGVYILYSAEKTVLEIKGTAHLQQALMEKLDINEKCKFFTFEVEPMYSKRESELLQMHIQKFGEMPAGDDELDDLF